MFLDVDVLQRDKILYIGNFLAKHGFYPSQGSILVDVLQKTGWDISWASSIKKK